MKWRDGVGERLSAWNEMELTVLPSTSVNSIFHLHFLYLYTPHVSDILKSQLFFSGRPIQTEVNSTDCFPSLPVMKLDEIPAPLQSSFLSTVSCLRTKFGKGIVKGWSKRLRNELEWLDTWGYKIKSEGFQLFLFSFANFWGGYKWI